MRKATTRQQRRKVKTAGEQKRGMLINRPVRPRKPRPVSGIGHVDTKPGKPVRDPKGPKVTRGPKGPRTGPKANSGNDYSGPGKSVNRKAQAARNKKARARRSRK